MTKGNVIVPWERLDFEESVAELFGDEYAKSWMSSPNPHLGGHSPEELMGTPDEPKVRKIIQSALVVGVS